VRAQYEGDATPIDEFRGWCFQRHRDAVLAIEASTMRSTPFR
jgi:hypothetical protein